MTLAAFRVGLHILALLVHKRLNPVLAGPPYRVPQAAQRLHNRLIVADLHADPLLWDADLSRRNSIGHVDIPRLQAGNVALQVFGVVTKVPRPEHDSIFAQGLDFITLLALIERWSPRAWFSLTQRALNQARRLRRVEVKSKGRFMLLTSAKDLRGFLARRATQPELVSGLLALEGAHALRGNLSSLDVLYDAGFRMMSLTHLFDNEAGGASLGAQLNGLTCYGRNLIQRLDDRRIIIDLAHASPALFDDVLAVTTRPMLVSHTGVQGVCPNPRNLSDAQIKGIAARAGLIGIGFDSLFNCASGVEPIADSIQYAASLVGSQYVALGSDFDGVIKPPFDVSGMPLLTAKLIERGFREEDVQQIMGGNVIRFLTENLP